MTSYLLLLAMLIYVAVGSAIGGVARYLLGGVVQRILDTAFPAGILVVNITGSMDQMIGGGLITLERARVMMNRREKGER
jgi:fluoride ion exporter CrcB/FEX